MLHAYDLNIVPVVQNLLGGMYDFGVNGLGYNISEFHQLFLNSRYCKRIERADSGTVMGQSGIELCYEILNRNQIDRNIVDEYTLKALAGRSREYWTGWSISYYQWVTSFSFEKINELRNINEIVQMYEVYHEMDIRQFVDKMNSIYRLRNQETNLKRMRMSAGLSQRNLADMTDIPIKTIQQYEQRQKNINNASVDYVVRISRALKCDVEALLEIM